MSSGKTFLKRANSRSSSFSPFTISANFVALETERTFPISGRPSK